ncbi:MAG: UDP-N-acetylmuramate dehydrogenase [Catonella sp.]|uniref:UDP-N-acetylmuramate dehydrogenase n=1 Tax=Catonella sp. TaxID=2382125 RepID=UPI003F9F6FE3
MNSEFVKGLQNILCGEAIFLNEPMSEHTSFKIGGPAEVFLEITTMEELLKVTDFCRKEGVRFFVLGNGSNLLVADEGLEGVIIHLSGKLAGARMDGDIIRAGAGLSLSALALFAAEKELTGLEFASGIPGSVGGAICMNAGAYGGEMKDVVEGVYVLTDGMLKYFSAEDMEFSYRHSILSELKNAIVVTADFKLMPGKKEEILSKIDELTEKRREKQPLEYPSAGSTFKRPETGYASQLIEEAGLKGTRIGGAEVSKKHSGFIINADNATANDVKELIAYVRKVVEEKSGVKLSPEVKML